MSKPEFTDAQVVEGIHAAMKEKNWDVVIGLLHLLAVQAPGQAELLRAAIELAAQFPRQATEKEQSND